MIKSRLLLLVFLLLAPMLVFAQEKVAAPIKIAISNDTYPYMYLDSQNQPGGLVVDWWRALASAENLSVEFVAFDWADIMQALDAGEVDIIGGMALTEARLQKYLMGPVISDVYSNVFVHRDLLNVTTIAHLRPHLIGVVQNSGHIAALQAIQPDLQLVTFDNTSAMFDGGLDHRVKAFVTLDRLTPRYSKFEQLNLLYPVYKKIPLQKIQITFAVGKENSALFQQLNEAVSRLPLDLTDKLQRRWLSAAGNEDALLLSLSVGNQPLMSVSPNGQPQGLLVDLWQLWSEKTSTPVVMVPDSTPAGIKSLRQGRVDVHMGYPLKETPQNDLHSAFQIYQFSSSFYYPSQTTIRSLNEVKRPVGVFTSASYLAQLQQDFPDVTFQTFEKLDDMTQAVERQQIAGFFGADLVMQQRLQLNSTGIFKSLEYPRYNNPLHITLREGNSILQNKIQQGFSALSQDDLEKVEKKWIAQPEQRYFSRFRQQVPLSEAEKAWLKQQPQFKVGVLADWPPMEFVNQDGQFSGVTQDVLELLNQRLNSNFIAVPFHSWEALENAFVSGQLDLVANMSDLPERRKYANFSYNFWPLQWTLISHNSQAEISQLHQLQSARVAVLQEYQIGNFFKENYPSVQLLGVESLESGLKALHRGDVDFVVDTLVSSGRALRQTEHRHLRMHLPTDMPTYPSLFAVRKDRPELLQILDKGLKTLNETDRTEILDRWFSIEINQGFDQQKVFELVIQIVGIGGLLIALVFFWNLSLRKEIELRREMEKKMRFMATHDDLTQLANRALLEERLNQALLQHARHHERLALLFLDLDGFKEVNDQFGHHLGDELLVKVAQLLQHCVRKSDTVARFGGDEFVILLTAMLDKDDAAIVAEKILLHLSAPIQLSGCLAKVGVSIGIALYPDDGVDSQQMLKVADSLMYQAKQAGKGCYRFRAQGQ